MFEAGRRAAANLGYQVIASDPGSGILSFNTGRSMRSWSGQDMSATFIAEQGDKCKVVLGGGTAMRGNPFGGGGQVAAWGEKGTVAERFLGRVAHELQAMPAVGRLIDGPPSSGGAAGPSDTASRVEALDRLARLHRDGMINDQEFATLKAELVSSASSTVGSQSAVPAVNLEAAQSTTASVPWDEAPLSEEAEAILRKRFPGKPHKQMELRRETWHQIRDQGR